MRSSTKRVWLWEAGSDTAYPWHLVVRRELDSPHEINYSLSHAPAQTTTPTLAHQQAQRYWSERAFQDSKSHIGLAHCQARKWQSWRRHMALAMIAGLFMLQQRMTHEESYPLLSCYDIQLLLAKSLPNKQTDFTVLLAQVQERHPTVGAYRLSDQPAGKTKLSKMTKCLTFNTNNMTKSN